MGNRIHVAGGTGKMGRRTVAHLRAGGFSANAA